MKIPELTSPELIEVRKAKASLSERSQASSKKVYALRALRAQGENNIDDKESRISMVMAGRDIPASNDVDAQLRTELLQWDAISEAQEVVEHKLANAKRAAATTILSELKPTHDKIMTRLLSALLDAHTANIELSSMKDQLCHKEIGIRCGVCELLPNDVLGEPNHYSPLADFMRAAVKSGYLKALPKEFQA